MKHITLSSMISENGTVRPSPTMQVLMWKRWSSAAVCLEVRELEILKISILSRHNLERSLPSFPWTKITIGRSSVALQSCQVRFIPNILVSTVIAPRCPCQISPRNKDHMPAVRIPKLTWQNQLWHHGNVGKHESTAMELPWNSWRVPIHTGSEFG